jgi:hypothetical protein
VVVNGHEAFARIEPAMRVLILTTVNQRMTQVFKEYLPDAGAII